MNAIFPVHRRARGRLPKRCLVSGVHSERWQATKLL